MYPSPRARHWRAATTAVLILWVATLVACVEPLVPAFSGPQPRLDLSVWLIDAGDSIPRHLLGDGQLSEAGRLAPAPGLLVASGTFWPGEVKGRLRRVTIGALRVNGVESLGIRATNRSLRFVIETPMARSTDTLTIGLPQVDGVRTALATLRLGLATRATDRSPSLSDAELRVPIVAASAPTVPSPLSRRWTLGLVRAGAPVTRVDGTGALPPELVVPVGTFLPGDGVIDVRLSDEAWLYEPRNGTATDTTYVLSARLVSTLRWPSVTRSSSP